MKLDIEDVQRMLEKRGIRINRSQKTVNASKPKAGVLGINTLGKLDFMRKQGFGVQMPEYKYFEVR